MLIAQGLTKRYRGRAVVCDVCLRAVAGEVTGFLGANGAGKTTTIRLMLGLARGGGTTSFMGKTLAQWRCPGRIVGAALGGVAGHPRHRVLDHLSMVAAGMGLPRSVVGPALDRVGMGKIAGSRIATLSLGMSQRVAIAQALLGDPSVLILDEPANGLDPHAIRWLRETLRMLASEGRAVFVSSHLLSEMESLADRIVVMGRGRIITEIRTDDIAKSANIVVETPRWDQLIGIVTREGGAARLDPEDGRIRISGLTRQQVGDLATVNAVPLHWLSVEAVSLEDFYMSVADQEYETG